MQGVRRVDAPTGRAVVTVEESGENAIVVAAGANQWCSAEVVRDGLAQLTAQDVVVAQAEIPDAAVRAAAGRWGRFVLNLAPYRSLGPTLLGPDDVLVVNEHEAQSLAAELGVDAEPGALHGSLGCGVVVTAGAQGAALATGVGVRRIPATAAPRVVDTTGAGDAFVGALASALASGRSLEDAVRWGGAAGALAVGAAGAQGGGATAAQIQALLRGAT